MFCSCGLIVHALQESLTMLTLTMSLNIALFPVSLVFLIHSSQG